MNSTDTKRSPEPAAGARLEQAEIDASARWPVLGFFASALAWLIVGGLLEIAASIQLHAPTFLSDCSFLTHGRLAPAAQNALVYGWGLNAGFGFALWLMARLSATTLRHGGWLFVAAAFWNLGVTLGVLGILGPYSTSFELLEMPRFVALILLASYALVGAWIITTFSIRNTENVYISQLYLFGAAFWFPWLYAIAQMMLFRAPARGVVQAIVEAWYVNGLQGLWFTALALAGAYYFLPKILGRAIHDYYLAPLAFGWFAIATSLAGGSRLIGAPVPIWVSSVGSVANFLALVPVVIILLNFFGTLSGRYGTLGGSMTLRFVFLGILGFLLSALLNFAFAFRGFAEHAQFTLFAGLRDWVIFYGCFSTTIFGAAYFLLPRITEREWRVPGLVKLHFATTALGLILMVVVLALAGWHQGELLNNKAVAFAEITNYLHGWLTFRTGILGLLFVGHLAFAVNFFFIACPLNSGQSTPAHFEAPPALTLEKSPAAEGHA